MSVPKQKLPFAIAIFHSPVWRFFASSARILLPQKLIKWLHGDFKSVSGRLYSRWELLQLFMYQARGGRYLDWYARRMDGFATNTPASPEIFRKYHDSGIDDLELLKLLGMKKTDFLHEFGCGFLRSAHYFINYLDDGRYSGNDASGERIATAVADIKRVYGFDVKSKHPLFIVNKDNSFDWLNRQADIVWCHAVFTHMPPEDIEDVFKNVHKIMKPQTHFYFTYSQKVRQRRKIERMGPKDWWHSAEFFEPMAAKHGLAITHISDFPRSRWKTDPRNHLVKLSLRSPAPID